jgi:hypothetical protein
MFLTFSCKIRAAFIEQWKGASFNKEIGFVGISIFIRW